MPGAGLPEAVLLPVVALAVQDAVGALPLQEHPLVVGLPSPGQQGEVVLAYEQRQQEAQLLGELYQLWEHLLVVELPSPGQPEIGRAHV